MSARMKGRPLPHQAQVKQTGRRLDLGVLDHRQTCCKVITKNVELIETSRLVATCMKFSLWIALEKGFVAIGMAEKAFSQIDETGSVFKHHKRFHGAHIDRGCPPASKR